jgi:hypothetical protein
LKFEVCQEVALLVLGDGDVTGGESLLYPHEVGEVCDTNILPEAGGVATPPASELGSQKI